MRLYSNRGMPNAHRVLMLLRENAFDIEIVELDIEAGAHKSSEFLAINPLGQVPALQLDDGTCIAESLPICRYLDAMSGGTTLFGATSKARAVIEMWERRAELGLLIPAVEYGHHTQPMFKGYFAQYPDWGNSLTRTVESCLALLDDRLAQTTWLGGDEFSIADVTAYCGFRVAVFWKMPLGNAPNVMSWADRLSARPCTDVIPR